MQIGYARVSAGDQSLALQQDALKAAGCAKIFADVASGATAVRTNLAAALEFARDGDILIVWRLDRLGRSLRDLIEIVAKLRARGVGFRSLHDAIDTTTPTGVFFFHVIGAFGELELNLIRERTRAGLAAARARGRCGGRPKALSPQQAALAKRLYDEQRPLKEICDLFRISKPTLYSYLRDLAPTPQ